MLDAPLRHESRRHRELRVRKHERARCGSMPQAARCCELSGVLAQWRMKAIARSLEPVSRGVAIAVGMRTRAVIERARCDGMMWA